MKAISLWEPWASAMAFGIKKNETRSWSTNYRGPLVICAAKKKMPQEYEAIVRSGGFLRGFVPAYGMAVCIVNLHGVVPTDEEIHVISGQEANLGDYTPGRFAWLTDNMRRFVPPFPVTGHQGFFDIPDELVNKHLMDRGGRT